MTSEYVVIVGGSRGIGKELVRILAAERSRKVIVCARNERIKELFTDLENVFPHILDLESENLSTELAQITKDLPRVDVLINNAGYLVKKPFPELTSADLLKSYQTNVFAVVTTVQSLLPKMEEHGAHIVNISSMGGFQGSVKFPGLTAYSTSKAALCSFTELFAEEYSNSKVKMNCLCLGAAQTEMLEAAFPGYNAPVSAAEMAEFIADFSLNGRRWFNGKILPVSLSIP